MEAAEGCMYVPENEKYYDMMKWHLDIVDSFFESDVVQYAEKECKQIRENPFVMADYCTADGSIALEIFKKMIEIIRRNDSQKEVMLVFEDKKENDYNALLKNVLEGGILNNGGIYALASSVTMYKQCLPSSSVHFIFSSFGTHYLSKRPCLIKNGMLTSECDKEERKLYSEQAAVDWQLFLALRAKELVQGGYMFVIAPVREFHPGVPQINVALRAVLSEGKITQRELENISVNNYMRSEEELRRPFKDSEKIKNLELIELKMYNYTIFKTEEGKMSYENAVKIMKNIRTWAFKSIVEHLDSSRSIDEKYEIAHAVSRKHLQLLCEMTENYTYYLAKMIIRKVGDMDK